MSLKRNITANYASQLYVTGVGILILPLYIKYMGAEAYGLVGLFTMLQAWFGLLDMGLTPTIGRETARYHGGSMTALAYRQLLRALTLIFAVVALGGGGGLWLFSERVAQQWLNVETLSLGTVVLAIQIMTISVALRWLGGLFRGVITGSEQLVWLSVFNAVIATLRFIAVFGSMWFYGFTPVVFFIHQLCVALLELGGLWLASLKFTPKANTLGAPIGWSFKPVKPVLKFSLSIAFTSSVWVLVTQTDKLVLSGILPLAEYGYFTLAVLVASGIMVVSGPVSIALMPRMARLNAEGKWDEMIQVYRNATQLVTVIAGSAAIVIAFNAELLLFAWTGDRELAEKAAPILRLYAIGNGFLAVAAFPYYLQYALGNLRYHLIGNAVMVVVLIPGIIAAATYYGGVGAGWVWLGVNGLFLLTWVGYVHGKLVPGLHCRWLGGDVMKIAILPLLVMVGSKFVSNSMPSRPVALLELAVISAIALTSAAMSTGRVHNYIYQRVKNA
ncbi:MAG: oligosaccharide flippase family protein [Gammaproteobacteria bacterium]|nr:oligosaccharide flippase family protein [Gammaproteobacteria bacterium]